MAIELRLKTLFEVSFAVFGSMVLVLNCFVIIKSTDKAYTYLLRAILEAFEILCICLVFGFLVTLAKSQNL